MFGSWSGLFEIRTKKMAVSLDRFIYNKVFSSFIKRSRLTAKNPNKMASILFDFDGQACSVHGPEIRTKNGG